jgi:hypothetical protein
MKCPQKIEMRTRHKAKSSLLIAFMQSELLQENKQSECSRNLNKTCIETPFIIWHMSATPSSTAYSPREQDPEEYVSKNY